MRLWPRFWNGSDASLLFDWSRHQAERGEDPRNSTSATALYDMLARVPEATVARLQAAGRRSLPTLLWGHDGAKHDAFSRLLRALRAEIDSDRSRRQTARNTFESSFRRIRGVSAALTSQLFSRQLGSSL